MLAAILRHSPDVRLLRTCLGGVRATHQWEWMRQQGHEINPCNSRHHPAVKAGIQPAADQTPVQEAYTPSSICWGCGPQNTQGLKLRSFRVDGGLEAHIQLPKAYQAFLGIMNGGAVGGLFDCHGNWTAAIALMDHSSLPKPPLTLTTQVLIRYKQPTPAETPLVLRSQVVKMELLSGPGRKATVQVQLTLHKLNAGGKETLLASAQGVYKKLGALRAM
ncbi:TPA: hypothetical protein ACH3X3_009698 [Trebouxia sp. C0006]